MRWTPALTLLGACLLVRTAHADGQERVLAAALAGDPALVTQVGEELARRGVSSGTGDEVVQATLVPEGEGIRVALRDPQGRATDRLVSTVDTAAALVESWARRDIADPLLEPRLPVHPPPPPLVAAPVDVVPLAPAAAAPAASVWTPVLRLDGESWHRSMWLAVSGGACARIGALCVGGAMRLARQLQQPDEPFDQRFQTGAQTDFETLALAELPISLGRPVLLLGLGAGVGWRLDGIGYQADLRGQASVGLALPIWSRLALDVGLTLAAEPGTDLRDPISPQPRPTERQLRMGFGLRWGLP